MGTSYGAHTAWRNKSVLRLFLLCYSECFLFWGTETDVAAFKPVKCESGERECYRRSRGTVSRWQQHSFGESENKLIIQNLLSQQFDKLHLFNKTRSVDVFRRQCWLMSLPKNWLTRCFSAEIKILKHVRSGHGGKDLFAPATAATGSREFFANEIATERSLVAFNRL